MMKSIRRYYFIALVVLLALSAYPLFMGLKIIALQLINGGISPEDYARYVIPYTAVCLSIMIVTALYPLISRLKKLPILAATVLALGLFVGIELYIESIAINAPTQSIAAETPSVGQDNTAGSWQLGICAFTPAALNAYLADPSTQTPGAGAILRQDYSDAFKIHYFLVSVVIIALFISIFYGYGSMRENWDKKKISLGLQSVSAVLLLGLCIFANFTGFFRERTDYLTPLSSFLTGLFFVVLGAAAGIYAGSRVIDRSKVLSVLIPSAIAVLVCCVMYFGEYQLLAGTLYRFGRGWFFEGLPSIALAPADMFVVLAAGAAAAGAMILGRTAYFRKNP